MTRIAGMARAEGDRRTRYLGILEVSEMGPTSRPEDDRGISSELVDPNPSSIVGK
jgi:hypothetical protein